MEEGSPKWSHLSRGSASASATPFLKLSAIHPAQIPHTSEKVFTAMYEEYLTYLLNLHEEDKMDLFSKGTFYTYWMASCFH